MDFFPIWFLIQKVCITNLHDHRKELRTPSDAWNVLAFIWDVLMRAWLPDSMLLLVCGVHISRKWFALACKSITLLKSIGKAKRQSIKVSNRELALHYVIEKRKGTALSNGEVN